LLVALFNLENVQLTKLVDIFCEIFLDRSSILLSSTRWCTSELFLLF